MEKTELLAAIAYFEDAIRKSDEIIAGYSAKFQTQLLEQRTHFVVALEAMRTPSLNKKPLTLEELWEMEMQPVYIMFLSDGDGEWRIPLLFDSGYCTTAHPDEFVRFTDKSAEPIGDYGKTWLAYHHPPEKRR